MQVKEKESGGTHACVCVFGRRALFRLSKLSVDGAFPGSMVECDVHKMAQWAQQSTVLFFLIRNEPGREHGQHPQFGGRRHAPMRSTIFGWRQVPSTSTSF